MPNINDLTYNGTNASSLGVYVTGSGTFNAPELDVTRYEVPGRNGDIILTNHRYKNIDATYPAFIPDAFMGKVQSIRNWLRSSVGYARLEDTYDTTHYRMGIATELQEFSPVNQNRAANFQMVFNCKPQRFLKSGETEQTVVPSTKTYSGNPASFESSGVYQMTSAAVNLTPQQDLNGYTKPWAGGCGSNIYPNCAITRSAADISVTHNVSDESYTIDGTASANRNVISTDSITLPAGTYYLDFSASATTTIRPQLRSSDGATTYRSGTGSFTLAAETVVVPRIYIANGTSASNLVYRISITVGSTAPSEWTPYTNICTITGFSGATLYVSPTTSQADATTYPVTFTDQGTVYRGTFNWVTGKLLVTWASEVGANMTWTYNATYHVAYSTTVDKYKGLSNFLCSAYEVVNTTYQNMVSGQACGYPTSKGINVRNDNWTAKADAVADLAAVQFVYELDTPLEYNLTPVTVSTLAGQNYAWAEGSVVVQFAEAFNLTNPTNYTAKPIFKVTNPNNDTLTVNGETLTIGAYTGVMIIDCETENAYAGSSNLNSLVTGTFPTLESGVNTISCSAATCKVIPRWWEL